MNVILNKQRGNIVRILVAFLVAISFSFTHSIIEKAPSITSNSSANAFNAKLALYDHLSLAELGLTREAFNYALNGYSILLQQGKIQKDNILSILDFSLPSGKKRLFILDLVSCELLFYTYASHGKKSGTSIPTKFSNNTNSNKSSLGFYLTGDTYKGKHGESLRLLGEEKGINDKAFQRGIVIHSATYVDETIIANQGFIGRSQGCPAIPKNVYKEVIAKIKEGSCLFIYSPDKYYASHSKMIREKLGLFSDTESL